MKVIVKTINKNMWAGVAQYKNCSTWLSPYLTRTGRVYTGLTEEEEKRLGEKLRIDLSSKSIFWVAFHIKMGAKDLVLDLDDPYDELRYIFLKGHKRVANGLADRKATANYVIINEESEAKETNIRNKVKRQALREFDKMTLTDMKRCLRILGSKADEMSSEVVEQKLGDAVESDPTTFLDKWVNNTRKETEFLVQDAVAKNVLRKNKNVYRYGTDIIGHTLEEVVVYLDAPENQDLKFAITKETSSK
jgi:hypothetical protein